jgi:hypothetical protein
MPSWIKETAQHRRLSVGRSYSKRQAAEVMEVSIPKGSRDWGGIVRFSNAFALFITLEKGSDRYAKEHRYDDVFDRDLLYWDSRASHDKKSTQVRELGRSASDVIAFARLRERNEDGKTQSFLYLGILDFIDWWGANPVHFTWRLRASSDLSGNGEWKLLAAWRPAMEGRRNSLDRGTSEERPTLSNAGSAAFGKEGGKDRVTINRYERDPRARRECLSVHGTVCFVCAFDFAAVYGSLGKGFVYVHHRVPVAIRARTGEYELDPVRDLVPICGNCHAMVHRRHQDDMGFPQRPNLAEQALTRLVELRKAALNNDWELVD